MFDDFIYSLLTLASSFIVGEVIPYVHAEKSVEDKITTPYVQYEVTANGKLKRKEILGSLDRRLTPPIPLNKLSDLSTVSKHRKIKVAFLDAASLADPSIKHFTLDSKLLALRERILNDSPIIRTTAQHGENVVNVFLNTTKKYNKEDRFEYFYCPLADLDESIGQYKLEECLKWLKKEKVDAISISIVYPMMTEKAFMLFKELSENENVIIALASGNGHARVENSNILCKHLLNVLCVGAYSSKDIKVKADYSDYGPMINVWENGNLIEQDDSIRGTSYATPRALAKFLIAKMNNNLIVKDGIIKIKK